MLENWFLGYLKKKELMPSILHIRYTKNVLNNYEYHLSLSCGIKSESNK